MTILKQLQTKLPQFSWTYDKDFGSYFGSIIVNTIEKRINNDLYQFGCIYCYISSRMYGSSERSFIYATCSQKAQVRLYRKKMFFAKDTNKICITDKKIQGVIDKFVEQIDVNKFYLNK